MDTVQQLRAARQILADEERWTTGSLFEGDLRRDPLCKNTRVCALGALALAAYGPAAVFSAKRGVPFNGFAPEIDGEYWLSEDDLATQETEQATSLLNQAVEELDLDDVNSIVGLNDTPDLSRARRYELLLGCFDRAIEMAERAA